MRQYKDAGVQLVMSKWNHFLPFIVLMGCRGGEKSEGPDVELAVTEVVDGAAPHLRSWSGSMDCCGEDPHPLHGTVLRDGSVVMVGKAVARDGEPAGFVTQWRAPDGPAVGQFIDDEAAVILATDNVGSGSVLAQVVEVGDMIVAVGFEASTAGEDFLGIAVAMEPETLSVVARLVLDGPERGTSAVFESVIVTPSGQLILGGSWGCDRDEIEGLKSFGNIVGGRGVLVEVDPETWFDVGRDAVGPDDVGALVHEVSEVQSVKSMRATSDGSIVAVGHDLEERSGFIRVDSGLLDHEWTRFDDGFELTDTAVLETDGQEMIVLVGHGGTSTIDGHAKAVRADGSVLWTTTFGNPGLDPDDAPAGDLAPDKFIFDECWGVASTRSGVVIACGSGIEGCDAVDATSAEREQCQQDPRRAWRSHLV